MKTQTHSTIKAHLVRSFEKAAKASAPGLDRTWLLPLQSSGKLGTHGVLAPPPPAYPLVILYDQYNNAGTFAALSATFTDSPSHNADLADDFVVPSGQTWNVLPQPGKTQAAVLDSAQVGAPEQQPAE